MAKVHSPTIEERIEEYYKRMNRRLSKHILKYAKKIQSDRKKLPRKKGGNS